MTCCSFLHCLQVYNFLILSCVILEKTPFCLPWHTVWSVLIDLPQRRVKGCCELPCFLFCSYTASPFSAQVYFEDMPRDVPGASRSVVPLGTVQTAIINPRSLGRGAVGFLNRRGRFSERGFAKTDPAAVYGRYVLLQSQSKQASSDFPVLGSSLFIWFGFFFFKIRCYCTASLLSIPVVQAGAIEFYLCQLAPAPHVSISLV